MKYPLYSYRDNKVGFMMPQAFENEAAAVRGFSYSINGNEGLMNFSPADYDLYHVGYFDTEKGAIVGEMPTLVCSGSSVVGTKK